MKDSKPSLILFLIAGSLSIAARMFNNEILTLIAKPVVVPAIYYYYLQTKTRTTSFWFSVALWCFFIGDMIMILFPEDWIIYVMFFAMISYLIIVKYSLQDARKVRFNLFNFVFLTLILLLLSYIVITIVSLNIESILNNYFLYLAYGVILIIMVTVATFNYLTDSTAAFMNLCSMALCFLVSDLFYAINAFIIKLPIIDHINLFSQFMAYFFMVRYFNSRKKFVREPIIDR